MIFVFQKRLGMLFHLDLRKRIQFIVPIVQYSMKLSNHVLCLTMEMASKPKDTLPNLRWNMNVGRFSKTTHVC